ncbi:MAG: DNA adenine methylase [Candidatus Binatia bacterium]
MEPFLRWAGSKRKLLPVLSNLVPKTFNRYVEPFAGSACLFFALGTRQAILGDINDELMNMYLEVKNNVDGIIQCLSTFKCNEREYYRVRAINPTQVAGVYRAARFIYLNRFCFNGLYRTNALGQFNVPYGAFKSGALPTPDDLRACSVILRDVVLISGPFERTLEAVTAGDFVYIDPPYCIRSRRVFNEYSHFSFGDNELRLLRSHLARLDQSGISFLVSYGVSREAYDLAKGYHRREVVVQRQIASFAKKRRKSRELLITNY